MRYSLHVSCILYRMGCGPELVLPVIKASRYSWVSKGGMKPGSG